MTIYTSIVVLLSGICGAAESCSSPSITAMHKSIMEEVQEALRTNASGSEQVKEILGVADRKMRALVSEADSRDPAELSVADCITLSECWSRLKDEELAASWGRRAVARDPCIGAYIVLVRALCAVGDTTEAEQVIRRAATTCSKDEKFYLLHNMLALRYVKDKLPESAFQHYCATIDYMVVMVERESFYAKHLSRCLHNMSVLGGVKELLTINKRCVEWGSRVEEHLHQLCERCKQENMHQDSLTAAIRCSSQALVVLNSYSISDNGEDVLVGWAEMLMIARKERQVLEGWHSEVLLYGKECSQSMGVSWEGRKLSEKLLELISVINADLAKGEQVHALHRAMVSAHETVMQHVKLRTLVGHQVNEVVRGLYVPAGCRAVLVHITDPSLPEVRNGIQSLRTHAREMAQQPKIGLSCVIPDVNASKTRGADVGQLVPADSAPPRPEHIARLRAELKLPTDVQVEAADVKRFGISTFPVNILVDSSGDVLGTLTGSNPEVVARLLRFSRSSVE